MYKKAKRINSAWYRIYLLFTIKAYLYVITRIFICYKHIASIFFKITEKTVSVFITHETKVLSLELCKNVYYF